MPGSAGSPIICTLLLAAAGCGGEGGSAGRDVVTVFAAASTTDVIAEAARLFEARSGVRVVCSFDSSSNLARQIRAGAPAEVFLSADEAWMDELERSGFLEDSTRRDLLANELVVVAPVDRPVVVDLDAAPPSVTRIALGDPAHVPAGRYARQALERLGWWDALEPRLIPTLDVRAALRLVELGEVDCGIVYASDALVSAKVTRVAVIPSRFHAPIRYPVALCAGAGGAAREFVAFLGSPEVAEVFERGGFIALSGVGSR